LSDNLELFSVYLYFKIIQYYMEFCYKKSKDFTAKMPRTPRKIKNYYLYSLAGCKRKPKWKIF